MTKVPLVIYSRGERIVLGEADVEVKDGDMTVTNTTFEEHNDRVDALFKDNSEFSIGYTYNVGEAAEPFEAAVIPHLKVKEQEDAQAE